MVLRWTLKMARCCAAWWQGSCGARYPAWPRVCTGHGFEPSSNSMVAKSRELLRELFHLVAAQRFSHQSERGDGAAEVAPVLGRQGGRRHFEDGTHASQIQFSAGDLGPIAVKTELLAVESRRDEMPLSRGDRSGAGETVVLAHPENQVLAIEREISGKFLGWITQAGDQSWMPSEFPQVSPRRRATTANPRARPSRLRERLLAGRRHRVRKSH